MNDLDWVPCSKEIADPDQLITAPETGRKRGVLVVDDTREVRDTLRAGLWHYGFNVWVAASGPEAVARYRVNGDSIDIVLLDVRMPNWDGPRTLTALREVDVSVRCCFMSGDLGDDSVPDLLRFGAIHVFAKPFYIRSVVEVMMGLIPNDRATNVGEDVWDDDGGNGIGARNSVSHLSDVVGGVDSELSGMGVLGSKPPSELPRSQTDLGRTDTKGIMEPLIATIQVSHQQAPVPVEAWVRTFTDGRGIPGWEGYVDAGDTLLVLGDYELLFSDGRHRGIRVTHVGVSGSHPARAEFTGTGSFS